MTSKVLIAVDGSAPSLRAVDFIIDHVHRTPGASFILLHVWNLNAFELLGAVEALDDKWLSDAEEKASKAAFAKAIEKCEAAKVTYQTLSKSGHVGEAIVGAAESEGADFIVMGTRGLGGIEGLLMGSVAQQVLHLTKAPLTFIK